MKQLTEFWKKKLIPLEKHIKNHPNDLQAKETLKGYFSNIYLKKYLGG